MKDDDVIPILEIMAEMDEDKKVRRDRSRAAYTAEVAPESPGSDWTLRGLSEEDMGALSLTLQVRQEQAESWEAERWARIVRAVHQAVNQDEDPCAPGGSCRCPAGEADCGRSQP